MSKHFHCTPTWCIPLLAIFMIACGSDQTPQTVPADPVDQMVVAFEGSHTRAEIKTRLDRAMQLFDLPLTDENYSRAGSSLVALRRDLGPSEMAILDFMIRSHTPGVAINFPTMAGKAAAALASGDG
jgi:hypothetical protein